MVSRLQITVITLFNILTHAYMFLGGLKMVYKRPKHVKTNLTNEVTGPWLDNQFFTDSLQSDSSLSLNGDDNSILKNSLATLWGSVNTIHVRQNIFYLL